MGVHGGYHDSGRVGWCVEWVSSRTSTGGDVWHQWLSGSSGHLEGGCCLKD